MVYVTVSGDGKGVCMAKKERKKKRIWLRGLLITLGILIVACSGVMIKAYLDVKDMTDAVYVSVPKDDMRTGGEGPGTAELIDKKKPFSVLLLGTDTGGLGRTEKRGRTDTIIVATINPSDKSVKMLSIPRDTRTEIIGRGTVDKINHAHAFGGVEMTINTVQNFLNIPIDHYVLVNLNGFETMVDALGGVTVDNALAFSQDGFDFPVGTVSLDGEQALAYARMRYEDPEGDFGRNRRQRNLVTAAAKKALSMEGLLNYQSILDSLKDNMQTDLTLQDMTKLVLGYRQCAESITQYDTLAGEGKKIDGVWYWLPNEEAVANISAELRQHLELSK